MSYTLAIIVFIFFPIHFLFYSLFPLNIILCEKSERKMEGECVKEGNEERKNNKKLFVV
jgi:hypothetical protein